MGWLWEYQYCEKEEKRKNVTSFIGYRINWNQGQIFFSFSNHSWMRISTFLSYVIWDIFKIYCLFSWDSCRFLLFLTIKVNSYKIKHKLLIIFIRNIYLENLTYFMKIQAYSSVSEKVHCPSLKSRAISCRIYIKIL